MSYPVIVTTDHGPFTLTITVRGNKDGSGEREVRLEYSGPRSGVIDPFILNSRLQNETPAEYMIRHFDSL
jgi:hypothetical protein